MNRKVAIIDPLGAYGSSHHFYLFSQAKGLLKSRVDVSLYTNKETEDPKISGLNVYSFYGFLFSSKSKVISALKYFIGSIMSIFHARIKGVSVFHFHLFRTRSNMFLNALLVKLLFGKLVFTVHDISTFANNNDAIFFSKWIYRLADLVLTHNLFSKKEIIRLTKKNEDCIKIIPHPNYTPFINIQKDKNASKKQLGIPANKKVLLFFGMIKKVKGLEVLLQALPTVIEVHKDVILVVAGKVWENDFASYQELIEQYNLQENCILHTKFINEADVAHYYCASDLVVLPYKKIYQSGVLMMALSYEKLALTSDLPPLKEVIEDNVNGFLFESENVHALAKKINQILSDESLMKGVKANGVKTIKTKFNLETIGEQTKQAYATL